MPGECSGKLVTEQTRKDAESDFLCVFRLQHVLPFAMERFNLTVC